MNEKSIEEFKQILIEIEKNLKNFDKLEENLNKIKEKLKKDPQNPALLQTLKKCETAYASVLNVVKILNERSKILNAQKSKK